MNIPASSLMKGLTLEVNLTEVKALRVRIWLGCWAFRIGARIIGCGIKFGGRT